MNVNKISVVVPTYNRNNVLLKCIEGLINQDLSKDLYEVIIVDDCSTENPLPLLKNILIQYPNIKYIKHDINKGLASSRNTGIINAKYEIILFLDSDIVPELTFVRSHLQLHESCPYEFIAVVSNLRYDPSCIDGSNFARFMNNRYLGNRSDHEKLKLDFNDLSAQYFGGGISSAKKSIITEAGMFDQNFVKYGGEDEDMGYRLKKMGTRICFSEGAKAIHYDTVSLQRLKLKAIEWKRNAFPIILKKQPDYFLHTNLRYLIPIDFRNDNISLITKKISVRVILNLFTVQMLEKFALNTDRLKFFYLPIVFRALMAGWFLNIPLEDNYQVSSSVWE